MFYSPVRMQSCRFGSLVYVHSDSLFSLWMCSRVCALSANSLLPLLYDRPLSPPSSSWMKTGTSASQDLSQTWYGNFSKSSRRDWELTWCSNFENNLEKGPVGGTMGLSMSKDTFSNALENQEQEEEEEGWALNVTVQLWNSKVEPGERRSRV